MTLKTTLLPPNATSEEVAIDRAMASKLAVDLTPIDTNPLTCHAAFLPWLAAAMRVDISGLNDNEKRQLIANARAIHYHKGTVHAAQQALNAVFQNAKISMFNEPLVFDAKVSVGTDVTATLDATKFDTARRLINEAKNLGTRFGSFEVDLPDAEGTINLSPSVSFTPFAASDLTLATNAPIEMKGYAQWML